jgi:pyroglutamyl-peptidase
MWSNFVDSGALIDRVVYAMRVGYSDRVSRARANLSETIERAIPDSEPAVEAAPAPAESVGLVTGPVILVTGYEPFGSHSDNPSQEVAKILDGRRIGGCAIASAVLPVHHREASQRVSVLLAELAPVAVVHLGLAEGRARLALERVALNVMDYRIADNAGYRAEGEPCVPDGPAAYFATLPLPEILAALVAEGVPAYISNTAGTFLCNQVLYTTLHDIAMREHTARAGFIHLPLLPAMVAASGLDQPSMDLPLMVRGVETTLRIVAETVTPGNTGS